MVMWIFKARMLDIPVKETRMQEEQTRIKQLMQAMVWFKRLRNTNQMFRGFQEQVNTRKDKGSVLQLRCIPLERAHANRDHDGMLQPMDVKSDAEPTYGVWKFFNEKFETIIYISTDDQIDSDIIFDDPYVDNNSGQDEHDSTTHDQPFLDLNP
ncbi:hypothetical protein Tco_1399355 [Tanacetum coccineum]